jgi:hypothetical protein
MDALTPHEDQSPVRLVKGTYYPDLGTYLGETLDVTLDAKDTKDPTHYLFRDCGSRILRPGERVLETLRRIKV